MVRSAVSELEPESLEQQLKSNEACGYERGTHVKSARLINGTLGGSVSARVANRGLARPAQSLVHRGPGERRVREARRGIKQ